MMMIWRWHIIMGLSLVVMAVTTTRGATTIKTQTAFVAVVRSSRPTRAPRASDPMPIEFIIITTKTASVSSSSSRSTRFAACRKTEAPAEKDYDDNDSASGSRRRPSPWYIRSTEEADLATVAAILAQPLSSSSSSSNNNKALWSGWKNQLDQMWAQKDIEALLKQRCQALQEGQRALAVLRRTTATTATSSTATSDASTTSTSWLSSIPRPSSSSSSSWSSETLRSWWSPQDRLRTLVEKAAGSTAEPNVWTPPHYDNFYLTPGSWTWFQHAQLTARHRPTGRIVGFCEVALLANPLFVGRNRSEENTSRIKVVNGNPHQHHHHHLPRMNHDDDDDDDEQQDFNLERWLDQLEFLPAVVNVGVDTEWRRQGIATRLLQSAETLVRRAWQVEGPSEHPNGPTRHPAPYLGLYVEKTNAAAVALYQGRGYQPRVLCPPLPGTTTWPETWYMIKKLERPSFLSRRRKDDQKDLVVDLSKPADDDDDDGGDPANSSIHHHHHLDNVTCHLL